LPDTPALNGRENKPKVVSEKLNLKKAVNQDVSPYNIRIYRKPIGKSGKRKR
jgi:hypothetical protein